MYDLSDLIFEKYSEGKLTEDKMILLLETSSNNHKTLYNNKIIKAIPNVSVGGIKFGMNRDAVRKIINNEYSEFKKHQKVKNTTDDFGFCHVYYDEKNKCEAIEFFDDVEILLGNKTIFPSTLSSVKQMINDIEKDGSLMYISKSKSIGITVNEKRKIKSILFGCKKYYTNQVFESYKISLVEHELPLSYKGVKLSYYNDEINEKTDMPYIKNALKILNSAKCQSMIDADISRLDECAEIWGCPDYRKYMKIDYVKVKRHGNKITFNINWNSERENETRKFFEGHFYSMYVNIDGNNITEVYGGLNG